MSFVLTGDLNAIKHLGRNEGISLHGCKQALKMALEHNQVDIVQYLMHQLPEEQMLKYFHAAAQTRSVPMMRMIFPYIVAHNSLQPEDRRLLERIMQGLESLQGQGDLADIIAGLLRLVPQYRLKIKNLPPSILQPDVPAKSACSLNKEFYLDEQAVAPKKIVPNLSSALALIKGGNLDILSLEFTSFTNEAAYKLFYEALKDELQYVTEGNTNDTQEKIDYCQQALTIILSSSASPSILAR